MIDGKLARNWYTLNVPVNELEMIGSNIFGIENDAFAMKPFQNLQILYLSQMKLLVLNDRTFFGLKNLRTLHLGQAELNEFVGDVFGGLLNLKFVILDDCGDNELTIDNLFGRSDLLKLDRLTIVNCNLGDRITVNTFSGLKNVIYMSLTWNQITRFGENSFSTVLNTVKKIDLRDNKLKILDKNLFQINRPFKHKITISLGKNPWHCDCKMDAFRKFIQSSENIQFDIIRCESPTERNYCLLNSFKNSFCDLPKPTPKLEIGIQNSPPMQGSPKEQELSSELPKMQESSKKYTNLQCEMSKKSVNAIHVSITPQAISPIHIENDELFIDPAKIPENYILVLFKPSQLSVDMGSLNCLVHPRKHKHFIHLEAYSTSNQMHQFCLVDKTFEMVPLNCYSFNKNENSNFFESDAWIMMEQKTATIVFCVVLAFALIFIGILLVFAFDTCFPNKIKKQKLKSEANGTPNVIEVGTINRRLTIIFIYQINIQHYFFKNIFFFNEIKSTFSDCLTSHFDDVLDIHIYNGQRIKCLPMQLFLMTLT